MPWQFTILIIAFGGTWLLIVSVYLFRTHNLLRSFTKDLDKGTLLSVLKKILRKEAYNKKELKNLENEVNKIKEDNEFHIQKVGLVRFNPFDELGGDHSFALILLDKRETGILITGLHTRERTRVYIKDIVKGKSSYDLSNDEKKALRLAQKKH